MLKKYGHLHYLVKLDDGHVFKCHINQLKATRIREPPCECDILSKVSTE